FGTNDNAENHHLRDLSRSEYWQLVPLALLAIWLGVNPKPLMNMSEKGVQAVVNWVQNPSTAAPTITVPTQAPHAAHSMNTHR
ncbi:MAG: Fe-S-binding domain-containing protein, partial [Bacteroidota bacterium]